MATLQCSALARPARVEARTAGVRSVAAAHQRKESAPAGKQAAAALLSTLVAAQVAILPLAGPALAAQTQEVARLAETAEPDAKNLGPNEVSKELIGEFPNASEKDKAAPGRSGTTFNNPSKDTGALTSTEGVGKATIANTKEAAKGGLSSFFDIFKK